MYIKQKVLMQSEYKKMKRLPEEEKMSFKNRKTAQSGLRSHMRNSVREAFRAAERG